MNFRKKNFLSVLLFVALSVVLGFSACKMNTPAEGEGEETKKEMYSITYDSRHGILPETVYVEKGTILTESLLPQIELKGQEKNYISCSFDGWQIDGVPVRGEDGYKVESNIVLDGVWMTTITYTADAELSTLDDYEWQDRSNWILTTKKIPDDSYLTDTYLMELTGCKNSKGTPLEFMGWMIMDNSLRKATNATKVGHSNIVLKAIFDKPFTDLVFISNPDGSSEKTITHSVVARPWSFKFSNFYFELTDERYNFKGWKFKGASDSEILDKNYSFPNVVDQPVTEDTYRIEFEAVWEKKQVTLTMYPNNGVSKTVTAKIPYGVAATIPDMAASSAWTYTLPDDASKVYRFEGWTLKPFAADDANAEIVYINKDTVIMDKDVELYAYWVTDRIHPVECKTPAGNVAPDTKIELVLHEDDASIADIYYTTNGTEPTKQNGILYDSEIELPNSSGVTKVKAKAFPKDASSKKSASAISTYNFTVVCGITLDRNVPAGAQVDEDQVSAIVQYGKSYEIPENVYSCKDYKLLGFSKRADAESPDYKLGDELNLTKGSTTLYAVWEAICFTVSYSIGKAGSYAPDNLKVQSGYRLTATDLPNISSEFNRFLGWKDANGTAVKKGYTVISNLELKAEWEEIKCKITYDVGDFPAAAPQVREVPYKQIMKADYLPDLSITGYWFDGWYMDEVESYYVTEGDAESETRVEKTRTVSRKVTEGSFIIFDDIKLYAKAHKKYNAMDRVKDGNNDLVAVIIKPSTQDEVAVGIGVKDYQLSYNRNGTEYYTATITSAAQKFFHYAFIPEIIAYSETEGDKDGSDNFDIILQYMKSNGIKDGDGYDGWTVDQRLYDEARAFYNAVHYASNEATGAKDDRDDVFCKRYTKYTDGWYIPTIYEIGLYLDLCKNKDLANVLKNEGKLNFGGSINSDYINYIASSNQNPYSCSSDVPTRKGFTTMLAYTKDLQLNLLWKSNPTSEYTAYKLDRQQTQFIYMRKFAD